MFDIFNWLDRLLLVQDTEPDEPQAQYAVQFIDGTAGIYGMTDDAAAELAHEHGVTAMHRLTPCDAMPDLNPKHLRVEAGYAS